MVVLQWLIPVPFSPCVSLESSTVFGQSCTATSFGVAWLWQGNRMFLGEDEGTSTVTSVVGSGVVTKHVENRRVRCGSLYRERLWFNGTGSWILKMEIIIFSSVLKGVERVLWCTKGPYERTWFMIYRILFNVAYSESRRLKNRAKPLIMLSSTSVRQFIMIYP